MSNENPAEGIKFTPRGYITVSEAIERLYFSNSNYLNRLKEEYGRNEAVNDLCRSLYAGNITASVLNYDNSLQDLPQNFWNSDEAKKIIRVNGCIKDRKEILFSNEHRGWILLSEKEFTNKLEILVIPAPDREMPGGLLFLSSSDVGGAKSPVTYMDIEDALQSVADQRKAYVQDTSEENWDKSRDYLRSMLHIGRIRAFHRDSNGYMRLLRASDWSADGPIMHRIFKEDYVIWEPVDWEGEKVRPKKVRNIWLNNIDIHVDGRAIRGHIIVLNSDLMQILQNFPSTDSQQRFMPANPLLNSDANTGRGGRPPDHDREAFLIEAFKIIYLGPEPKTQADLNEKTVKAYQDERERAGISKPPPGETWMKDCTRALWRWIAEGRKGR